MVCAEFEDLLVDYYDLSAAARASVDSHTAVCAECRVYRNTIASMDVSPTAALANRSVSNQLRAAVMRDIRSDLPAPRPSIYAAILDLIGGAAVFAVALFLAYYFTRGIDFGAAPLLAAGALFLMASLFMACRTLAAYKH